MIRLAALALAMVLAGDRCRWQLMEGSSETGACFSAQHDCQRAATKAGNRYWCKGR